MASSLLDYTTWAILDMTVKDAVKVIVNDIEVDLGDTVLPGNNAFNFANFQPVTVNNVDLNVGTNTVVVEIIGAQGPNLDYMDVYAGSTITPALLA